MNELIPIVGILAGCGSVVFIVNATINYAASRQRTRAAAEFHSRLLDRLGSTKDFSEFLNSAGGGQFLDSLALQREMAPQQRILRATASGIVLTVLGLGLAMFNGELNDPGQREFTYGLGFLSAISLSLGIGLLLAAALTERLARRFGMIPSGVPDREPSAH